MGFSDALGSAVDKLNSLLGLGGDSWRDKILEAKYDGVPFHVLDSTLSGGHRNVRHEYPKRPVGWVEEMGPTLEQFSISGFVAGEDYFAKRDALIAALRETDRKEPATLQDPYMGEVKVVCDSWDKAESMADGGMAVFTMTFTQAGDPATLIVTDGTTKESLLSSALEELSDVTKQATAAISLVGAPARILNAAIAKVKSEVALAMSRIESALEGVVDAYADLLGQFIPENGSNAFSEEALTAVQTFMAFVPLEDLLTLSDAYDTATPDEEATSATPSEQRRQKNDAALNAFFRKTYLGTAAKAVVEVSFPTYDETLAVRDNLVGKLTRAGEQLLAAYVFNFLNNRSAGLARLTEVETPRFVSSLELAHTLYGDASREDEIVQRNGVEHPGFIRNQPLKVLQA